MDANAFQARRFASSQAHADSRYDADFDFDLDQGPDLCDHGCEHMRLMRPQRGRVFGGVCLGLARWLGWEPWAVRAGVLALALLTSALPVIVAYGLLWLLMPDGRPGR